MPQRPEGMGMPVAFQINDSKLEEQLCAAKEALDKYKDIYHVLKWYDPFKAEKYKIAKKYDLEFISNAWLKCYEILSTYVCIVDRPYIYHFDNAALPGSFILATRAYISNNLKNSEHVWKASSLMGDGVGDHLEDTYGLYAQNPDNWMMNSVNNGDITSIENIQDITNRLNDSKFDVDLYTSDVGFDVSYNYNGQEIEHYYVNVGQILLCIKILARGGSCIIKHFTCFKECTVSYLAPFMKLFNKFTICKPLTSKRLNSEIYLVGIGFKKTSIYIRDLTRMLENILITKYYTSIPRTYMPKHIQEKLYTIYITQIQNLRHAVQMAEFIEKSDIQVKDIGRHVLAKVYKKNKSILHKFYKITKL